MGDIRDDINAAFEASDTQETPAAPEPTPTPEVEAAPVEGPGAPNQPIGQDREERSRDDRGRFAPKAVAAPPEPTPTKAVAPEPKVAAEPVKAPQSWKAHARELVAKLPPEFKPILEEVNRRDREIETAMRESAESRQVSQRFREAVAPFEYALRSSGTDPFQAFQTMMRSTMVLANGAPGDKVDLVADVIQRYGVDLGMLANRLEGKVTPQQVSPDQYRDPRVDALLSQVEQARAQRSEVLNQEAARMIGEVQNEEFFADVRDAMADILEVSAKRGVAMTPREAYNRAVWADPHVAEVLQQRQAAKQAGNLGSTQRAAAAASSVRGSPAVANTGTQSVNLRGDIEAALERLRDR